MHVAGSAAVTAYGDVAVTQCRQETAIPTPRPGRPEEEEAPVTAGSARSFRAPIQAAMPPRHFRSAQPEGQGFTAPEVLEARSLGFRLAARSGQRSPGL